MSDGIRTVVTHTVSRVQLDCVSAARPGRSLNDDEAQINTNFTARYKETHFVMVPPQSRFE